MQRKVSTLTASLTLRRVVGELLGTASAYWLLFASSLGLFGALSGPGIGLRGRWAWKVRSLPAG